MSRPFVASVQYGDLNGTVSIDGFMGSFVNKLLEKAKIPKGYVPVGIDCFFANSQEDAERNTKLSGRFFSCSLVAVKGEEYNADAIRARAENGGKLDVYTFNTGELEPEDVLELIKRMNIKVIDRNLAHLEIEEHEMG